jgi:hypothetical protein
MNHALAWAGTLRDAGAGFGAGDDDPPAPRLGLGAGLAADSLFALGEPSETSTDSQAMRLKMTIGIARSSARR